MDWMVSRSRFWHFARNLLIQRIGQLGQCNSLAVFRHDRKLGRPRQAPPGCKTESFWVVSKLVFTPEVRHQMAPKKVGLPLGTGSPEKARSIVSVVFTPTRGVIHPSFPLRGRWERTAKNGEQAPSPSLTAFYISSCKTRLHSL